MPPELPSGNAPYGFAYDRATRVLVVRMTGLWSLATFAAFLAEGLARGMAIRLRDGEPASIFDARDFPVQTSLVANAMGAAVARAEAISKAPAAIVVTSPLAAMQARRLLPARHNRFFHDMAEAQAWLADEWRPSRALRPRPPL